MVVIMLGAFIPVNAFAEANPEGFQTYKHYNQANSTHKQLLAEDIDRYRNADNLWEALREEFTLSHYENNPEVQAKIEWYLNNQGFLYRSINRASPYLYYIFQQVKKRHLPAEIVLLPIIESGYNPLATSSVGAAGIWQLMPATAAGLGVRQDWWFDGRRDVITSTRAALNHLAYLQNVYDGNWLLALAAYDTGEGNLRNAILKNIRNGRNTDFWSLPVAYETRNYVPSLLALAVIISHPDKYPIDLPYVRNAPYLAQVDVTSQIHLQVAAAFAGISYKKLKQLNPGYSQLLTPSKGPSKLVLPIERVEQFITNLVRSPLNTGIKWVHYRVNSGDTLQSLARKFNTTPEAITSMNHLAKNKLSPGLNILISTDKKMVLKKPLPIMTTTTTTKTFKKLPPHFNFALKPSIKATRGHYKIQPGDTIYMVRKHDSVQSIANHFHIHANDLVVANNLRTNMPLPHGRQLIIPTHPKQDNSSLQPGDTVYMVRRGDTLEKIADKFHTNAAAIRLANLVDNNSLHEGERILVPTHVRS